MQKFNDIIQKLFSKKIVKWIFLALLIVVIIIFLVMRKSNDVVVIKNHKLYQYFNGFRVDYSGVITLNQTKDEITKITFKDDDSELDSTPLYYADDDRVLFPKMMSVIYPMAAKQYKINYYSEAFIEYDEVVIKDKKNEKRIFDGIVYDGADLYFLTSKNTITIGNNSYEVSPLSYIIVDTLNKKVSIFDHEKEKFTELEEIYDNVIISNGKYKVNASLDLMYYDKGSKLLLKDISKLFNLPLKD